MARKKEEVIPFSSITVDDAQYKTILIKKYENRKKWTKKDESILSAIIPGTIGKIYVSEGDDVSVGQKLLVLEAMKMLNQILASVNGKIKKVHVKEGDRVTKEQLLIEIEEKITK